MTELSHEIAELKHFISDLKADRTEQKEKERREAWTKYTSMSLVFIAVLAAIAMQWSGKYSGRGLVELNNSTFFQASASDQWSYYQAKSIKQNLYESMREVNVTTAGGDSADAARQAEAFNAKVARYEAEKKDIKDKAEALEKQRDAARQAATRASEHGSGMGTAVSVFQVAIAVGSICLVTKKKPLWYISMLLALAATAKMVWVWMH